LKPSQIFFDQTTFTICGIDNRDGQDAKKSASIQAFGKVITEIVMRKDITKTDLEKYKATEYKDLKFENIEQ